MEQLELAPRTGHPHLACLPEWENTTNRDPLCGCRTGGDQGLLRIKKKRGKWIADVTMTQAKPAPSDEEGIMGIDLGIKVPAVAYIAGKGTRFFGNGRYQRHMRRLISARRKKLQKAKKTRAVKKSQGKEARWMKNINHQLSRQIVNHAQEQGVLTIKVEALQGIRKGTTSTSRGGRMKLRFIFRPQKQPHEEYLELLPTHHLHHLQG